MTFIIRGKPAVMAKVLGVFSRFSMAFLYNKWSGTWLLSLKVKSMYYLAICQMTQDLRS